MRTITSLPLVAALAFLSLPASAATIAIVDSGTDLSHPELVNKMWTNPNDPDDALDNDDNGYIDDTHGWNFADNDNHLFDKKLLGTFSPDVHKFFDVQLRVLTGTATADDETWMKEKKQDQSFLPELETFANFVHGTHVAGITAKGADAARVMPLKILATDVREAMMQAASSLRVKRVGDWRKSLVFAGLHLLAKQQGAALAPVGQYVHDQHAQIANCSFGSSAPMLRQLLKPILPTLLGRIPSDAEVDEFLKAFMTWSAESMERDFTGRSPETLFVAAAGNDGTDNDAIPAVPAGIRAENVISVAATWGYNKLASFSNYGAETVDLAAPGVGIRSSIPGGEYLTVSGTSQAAPFVSNIAGQVLDANPRLGLSEVRVILMETVDKKEFLVGKVRSAGIANPARALYAAKLSLDHSLADAIQRARAEVGDMMPAEFDVHEEEAFVMPLFNLLK